MCVVLGGGVDSEHYKYTTSRLLYNTSPLKSIRQITQHRLQEHYIYNKYKFIEYLYERGNLVQI